MATPRIIPRAQHTLSRKDIDPDALKVLNRLRQFDHVAYLVGGSVRDLLLGRRPKDFDIGTSAHPYQVKRLFRNCWIIGRRFRLAHVKFGQKTIEVATFRRQVSEAELEAIAEEARSRQERRALDAPDSDVPNQDRRGADALPAPSPPAPTTRRIAISMIHRDNTFGTPEEDAFRRDFTVNALFYDIATFSVIDYVGGLDDLHARVIRCIGDPDVRFREDPVRMLRAIVLAARLDFTIDPPVVDAIRRNAPEIARSAAARLVEEFYKILRSGRGGARVSRARRHRAAPVDCAGARADRAATRLWESLARPRPLPPSVRGGARVDDQRRAARHAARAARLHRAPAVPAERSDVRPQPARPTTIRAIGGGASATSGATRKPRSACCRCRGAMSNGCGRCSGCSGG